MYELFEQINNIQQIVEELSVNLSWTSISLELSNPV